VSNHWNRNPFDSILPAEISNVKGVYPIDMIARDPHVDHRPAGLHVLVGELALIDALGLG
jgi:hypothetical protein